MKALKILIVLMFLGGSVFAQNATPPVTQSTDVVNPDGSVTRTTTQTQTVTFTAGQYADYQARLQNKINAMQAQVAAISANLATISAAKSQSTTGTATVTTNSAS